MTTYDTDVHRPQAPPAGRPDVAEPRRPAHAPRAVAATVPDYHLPSPPSDQEKYSYFGVQRRWPFVWLFFAQACLVYAFVRVMLRTPDTALGLILLTVMIPPMVVNLWLRMKRRRLSIEEHVVGVETWRATVEELPSVDVFLPVCGENLVVLANTFDHVKALEWDGDLRVHVLDDAADAGTRELALEYGFDYVVRENRGEWKKAGNLIAAFDRTSADFIVVFDADFAPRTDFLWETVPYMADPTTGVVQTAQYFDVDERVTYFARYAGALQELFFRWIQPARDTCEAAICAGTNVVYRRTAVVAAGGFAQVPIGEDVHSGVKLWVANYHTRYVPIVLAKGLAPDSWNALTNQQYRWCRSSMLLMMSRFFQDAPFDKRQRTSFWAAFLYYMASAAMPLISVLPTLIMVWFFADTIVPSNYLLMVPSIISTLFVFPLVARGWSPGIYRVSTVNSFCHLLAVTDALRNQVASWVPTGAAAAPKKAGVPVRVAVIARTWFVLTQALLWVGIGRLVVDGGNPWMIWPGIALAVFQVYLLAPMLITLGPAGDVYPERRPSGRHVQPDGSSGPVLDLRGDEPAVDLRPATEVRS
jgi:cellulose synthase (UDP-forming)